MGDEGAESDAEQRGALEETAAHISPEDVSLQEVTELAGAEVVNEIARCSAYNLPPVLGAEHVHASEVQGSRRDCQGPALVDVAHTLWAVLHGSCCAALDADWRTTLLARIDADVAASSAD